MMFLPLVFAQPLFQAGLVFLGQKRECWYGRTPVQILALSLAYCNVLGRVTRSPWPGASFWIRTNLHCTLKYRLNAVRVYLSVWQPH